MPGTLEKVISQEEASSFLLPQVNQVGYVATEEGGVYMQWRLLPVGLSCWLRKHVGLPQASQSKTS